MEQMLSALLLNQEQVLGCDEQHLPLLVRCMLEHTRKRTVVHHANV